MIRRAPGHIWWWQDTPTLQCPFPLFPKMSSQAGSPSSFKLQIYHIYDIYNCCLWGRNISKVFYGLLVGNSREVDGGDYCNENNDKPESSIAPSKETSQECKTALVSQYYTLFLVFVLSLFFFYSFCLFVFLSCCLVVLLSFCHSVFLSFCPFVSLSFWF